MAKKKAAKRYRPVTPPDAGMAIGTIAWTPTSVELTLSTAMPLSENLTLRICQASSRVNGAQQVTFIKEKK